MKTRNESYFLISLIQINTLCTDNVNKLGTIVFNLFSGMLTFGRTLKNCGIILEKYTLNDEGLNPIWE